MNGTNYISLSSPVFDINMSEYKTQGFFHTSRIRQDKAIEEQMRLGYQGRELYEMIQNADDEKSPEVEISLQGSSLHISNWGDNPFTEVGIVSILRSFLSPKKYGKKGKGKPIGCKGLGFRSLLNWGSDIYIKSNGVCCHFSEQIAKERWEALKKGFDQTDIISFEAENTCPIPLLSVCERYEDGGVTKVDAQDDTMDRCTTDISIIVRDADVKKDIETKIKTLPSTVLLFLKSVRKITLKTESYLRVISCESSNRIMEHYTIVSIKETVRDSFTREDAGIKESETKWTVYTENGICEIDQDKTYEVAVAFAKGMPLSNPVYSFFPTEFVLNLPCILHGTFVLDDSRNRIPPSDKMNNYIFSKLGLALLTVSEHLAEEKSVSWDAFDIVNISKSDAELVPALAESLSSIKRKKIIPTIGGYSIDEGWAAYSEEMAFWLKENHTIAGELSCHLIPGYKTRIGEEKFIFSETRGIEEEKIKTVIVGIANELLKKIPDVDHKCYAKLIDAIQKSHIENVDVLYDSSYTILNSGETSYVVSAESKIAPPSELKLREINSSLIKELRDLWGCKDREVTSKLNGESAPYVHISSVSDSDLNRIKDQIVLWSKRQETTKEDIVIVLKWLYKSEKNRDKPLSHDMMLFGRDGNKHKAASLLLKSINFPYDEGKVPSARWLLEGDSVRWSKIFDTDEVKDVESFFYDVIGVSHSVPLSYEYFGDKVDYLGRVRYSEAKRNVDNYYFNFFGDKVNANYGFNYAWVPCGEYLNGLDLPEAMGLFAKEPRLVASIGDKILRYKKGKGNEPKTEQAKSSYVSFFIERYPQFSKIKTMSLYDNLSDMGLDYDGICKKYSVERFTVQKILHDLGAKYYASELSLQDLYDLIRNYNSDKNVEKFYHSIRDAIQAKKKIDGTDLTRYTAGIETLFARKNGVLGKYKREEVYYWDNDQLPKEILNGIPKLEIGSRIGEESVREIFGVNLAKLINIDVILRDKCEGLTEELSYYLNDRLKYILALRCREISDDNVKKEAAKIHSLLSRVGVFRSCEYRMRESEKYKPLSKGEFLVNGDDYCLVYDDVPVDIAIHDPSFCSSIEDIFSIAFQLTGKTDFISMIIKNSQKENEYAVHKYIRDDRWEIIKGALGLSSKEKSFWQTAFHFDTIDDNVLMSSPQRRLEYLNKLSRQDFSDMFKGGFPMVDDLGLRRFRDLLLQLKVSNAMLIDAQHGLAEYYRQVLENCHQKDKDIFEKGFYAECGGNYKEYIEGVKQFYDDWFMDVVEPHKYEVLSDDDLMKKYIQKRGEIARNIDFSHDYESLKKKPSYASIESELNLNDYDRDRIPFEIQVMVYFDDMQEKYRAELKKMLESEHSSESVEKECNETYSIGYGKAIAIAPHKSNYSAHHKKNSFGNNSYVSSERLHHIGKAAELKVFKTMNANDLFTDIIPFSSNLTGHKSKDEVHYDLTYKRAGDDELRFLEIKAKSGDYFLMSKGEYEFATKKENVDRYDVAVVEDNDITILTSPFSRGDLVPESDTLRINLKIEKQ